MKEMLKKTIENIFLDMQNYFTAKEICLYVKGYLNGANVSEDMQKVCYDHLKEYGNISEKFSFEGEN